MGISHLQSFKMVFARAAARSLPRASSLLSSTSPHLARRAALPSFQPSSIARRTLTATASRQGKVLLVLYDGHEHARDQPQLLGTTENELGIRKWLEDQGHPRELLLRPRGLQT